MQIVWTVAGLIGVFVSSHLLLAAGPLRVGLVRRLGEGGFVLLFSLVSWATFAAAVFYYAAHRGDGPLAAEALGLTGVAGYVALKWIGVALVVTGVALQATLLSPRGYVESPTSAFVRGSKQPYGLERITRHPMFVGIAAFGLGHMVLAERLVGVVFFAGLALLGSLGAWHQDRKLSRSRGATYIDYTAATSAVPFLALIRGQQTLVWSELPWPLLGAALLASWGLYQVHNTDFGYGAALVVLALVVVPIGTAVWGNRRRRRRTRDRHAASRGAKGNPAASHSTRRRSSTSK